MKKVVFISLIAFVCLNATAQDRPKLVVGIVVDQMRWDYLYRFQNRFGEGGFKRLIQDGYECKQTQIHYLPSYTGPGHASVYTGSAPALHGIVANDWIDRVTGKEVYCTEDRTVSPVGSDNLSRGQMSPRNMLATTVTDELRMATNFRSRVFGLSMKDRGSILPAGHTANGAFWFDEVNGQWISSSFYNNTLPQWLQNLNNRGVCDSLLAQDWYPLFAINTYTQSSADDNHYEGLSKGEKAPVFPHKGFHNKEYQELAYRAAGNTYTFLTAKALIEGEQLGQKGATDFLCMSFSATDYIGHRYAPNSIEVEDTYLRLDKELAEFLQFLDLKLGRGNYSVFLTADHGGAHNARWMRDNKMPAGSEFQKSMMNKLYSSLEKEIKDSIIEHTMNYQLYFKPYSPKQSQRMQELSNIMVAQLKMAEGVHFAVDLHQLNTTTLPQPLQSMLVNGYYPKRSGDIQIIPLPGWYEGYAPTGTTHAGWNPYDTRIPLLFFGWGIQKGSTNTPVHINDIAPTIAALLNIQNPNTCTGRVIEGVLKK